MVVMGDKKSKVQSLWVVWSIFFYICHVAVFVIVKPSPNHHSNDVFCFCEFNFAHCSIDRLTSRFKFSCVIVTEIKIKRSQSIPFEWLGYRDFMYTHLYFCMNQFRNDMYEHLVQQTKRALHPNAVNWFRINQFFWSIVFGINCCRFLLTIVAIRAALSYGSTFPEAISCRYSLCHIKI